MQFHIGDNNSQLDANSVKNNNMLKDVMNNIQPNKLRLPENQNTQSNNEVQSSIKPNYKSNTVNNEDKGQRKPRSFFDRFGAKQRMGKINDDIMLDNGYNDNTKNKMNEQQTSNDDLEIPACFRRKK